MPIFSHTVTGYLFALLATVVWSGNFVVARGLAGALSPVELSFWRWSIAFLTILPFAGRSLLRSLPLVRGTWGKVILMALLGITCFNTFIYQAGHTTDATNMSLLATASPIVRPAIAHLFLRGAASRFQFFGCAAPSVGSSSSCRAAGSAPFSGCALRKATYGCSFQSSCSPSTALCSAAVPRHFHKKPFLPCSSASASSA